MWLVIRCILICCMTFVFTIQTQEDNVFQEEEQEQFFPQEEASAGVLSFEDEPAHEAAEVPASGVDGAGTVAAHDEASNVSATPEVPVTVEKQDEAQGEKVAASQGLMPEQASVDTSKTPENKPEEAKQPEAVPQELNQKQQEAQKSAPAKDGKAGEQSKDNQAQDIVSTPTTTVAIAQQDLGLDTMDVMYESKGNWLYKRLWWERAQKVYEEIKNGVNKIFEQRAAFSARHAELERTVFNVFYAENGYERGELASMLDVLMQKLHKERAEKGALNEQERELLGKIEQEQEGLRQLQLDVKTISQLDTAFDDALSLLYDQINKCRDYEQQAWQNFRDIERELSDKKAKELFFIMNTLKENVDNTVRYVQGDFTTYFTHLSQEAHKRVERVNQALKDLQTRGLDVHKQVLEYRETVTAVDKPVPAAAHRQIESLDAAISEQQQVATSTFSGKIMGWLNSVWGMITGAVYKLYLLVTRETPALEQEAAQKKSEVRASPAVPLTIAEDPEQPQQETVATVQEGA